MKLVISLAITLAVGFFAGFATIQSVNTWYTQLEKPAFNPPNAVFGPVWTILYILMAISLYLVWKQPASPDRNKAMLLFFIQLALNFAWSFIFFYYHRIGLAVIDIALLWIFLFITILLFRRFSNLAAWLLAPYLAWVSFATILNMSIFKLN
jgi:translocator protein